MTLTRGELEYLLLLATREQRRSHDAEHPALFAHCQHMDCQFVHKVQDAVDLLPRRRKHQMIEVEVTP